MVHKMNAVDGADAVNKMNTVGDAVGAVNNAEIVRATPRTLWYTNTR
jgi:hypothetical protein